MEKFFAIHHGETCLKINFLSSQHSCLLQSKQQKSVNISIHKDANIKTCTLG